MKKLITVLCLLALAFTFVSFLKPVRTAEAETVRISPEDVNPDPYSGTTSSSSGANRDAGFYIKKFVIAAVIGLIIALIATSAMQAGMKNVHRSRNAANYVKKETLKIRVNEDRFLRTEEKRTRKQTNS